MLTVRRDRGDSHAVIVAANPIQTVHAAIESAIEVHRFLSRFENADDMRTATLELRALPVERPAAGDIAGMRPLDLHAASEHGTQLDLIITDHRIAHGHANH